MTVAVAAHSLHACLPKGHQQKDFSGNPVTVGGELSNAFTPLPITNYLELKNDPNSAPTLLGLIADALGIGVNTYGITKKKK